MISGINQEVDVLGRVFHFQTELTHERGHFLRTEVFLGGKIVATREQPLLAPINDDAAVRSELKRHHSKVLQGFLDRARNFQPKPPAETAEIPEVTGPPSAETREAAKGALRIRRMIRNFRERTGLVDEPEPELTSRLEKAVQGFKWVVAAPSFPEIRIDEQVRFHLVLDLIEEWLRSDRKPADAEHVWSAILSFNDYLTELNRRAELAVFDRQLLTWAASEVEGNGVSEDLLERLKLVYGRDAELDRCLEAPEAFSRDDWLAHLRRVLNQTAAA